MGSRSTDEGGSVTISEVQAWGEPCAFWSHPGWRERFPWLIQGTTDRSSDFGLFTSQPVGEVMTRWRRLREVEGVLATVHARQVHGSKVQDWRDSPGEAFVLADGYDAHLTSLPGVALTISVADCVPVFLVAEHPRSIGLAHAGWRGVAAGVLEGSIDAMARAAVCDASDLWLHCGPAICGRCYEVGPEVHAAVNPDAPPVESPAPIDLRAALVSRARSLGVLESRISVSAHCTRCGPGSFHSHRRGDAGRQLGLISILA